MIDNCYLPNQSNIGRKCVIYCDEIPNRILVKNSPVVGIPVIMVDPKIDLNNYFQGLAPGLLDFAVEHCTGYTADMPAQLKHPVILPAEGDNRFLTGDALEQRLQDAMKVAQETPNWSGDPAVFNGHREQIDPAKYHDIPDDPRQWTTEGFADAELIENAQYYAVSPGEGGTVIMRKHPDAANAWVVLKDVAIDLDAFPWLTLRLKPIDAWYLPCTVRIIDQDSGHSLMCPYELGGNNIPAYYAFHLRKTFGSGIKRFDIRIYVAGSIICTPQDIPPHLADAYQCWVEDGRPHSQMFFKSGELIYLKTETNPYRYTILEYLRAEAD
jgi:hypothetical protein